MKYNKTIEILKDRLAEIIKLENTPVCITSSCYNLNNDFKTIKEELQNAIKLLEENEN